MSLSPMTPVPIAWQNSFVDIQPTSRYGEDHDTAMINTSLLLQAESSEEVVFVLPTADAPEQAPVMRVVSEAGQVATPFEGSDFDEVEADLAEALSGIEKAQREFWEAVKAASVQVSKTRVHIKKGDQLVRFFYPQRIPKLEDGSLELKVLAPLASFVIATGGSISFAVALPRVPGQTVTVSAASAENPPGTLIGEMSERVVLAQRNLIGHFWQNDPLYRVKYSYS